jgi:hypothetical protein
MKTTRSGKANPWSGAIKKMDPGRRPENIEAIRDNWDQIDWGRDEG